MFLRCQRRKKDGKTHENWSSVESRRVGDGRIVQRQVLYLGHPGAAYTATAHRCGSWRCTRAQHGVGELAQPMWALRRLRG